MRACVALFIVMVVAFVFVGTSAAATGGDMKASPLFKRSLEESIASLEGKALQANGAKGEAEAMPTGKPGCPEPDAPLTSYGNTCDETCSPTQCGGECYTQANTCYPTACGGTCYETCSYTCASTCGNTCSGATCSSTCAGGVCPYHYIWRGLNKWNYDGQESANWYGLSWHGYSVWWGSNPETTIEFLGSGAPPDEGTSWLLQDGFYEIDKWYSSAITNIYDIESEVTLRGLQGEYIRFYSVLHSLSPPDATGYYKSVIFYFY